MSTHTTFEERLRYCAQRVGGIEAWAQKAGISRRSLDDYLAGKGEMRASRLFLLAGAAGVSPVWLQTGMGPVDDSDFAALLGDVQRGTTYAELHAENPTQAHVMQETAVKWGRIPPMDPEGNYVFVPRLDVKASAGAGRANASPYVSGSLAFRRDWVEAALRVPATALITLSVEGDSMSPTFEDGDVALVDKTQREVGAAGVYVFTVGDDAYLKRLQRRPGGPVMAISDNGRYEPFPVPADARIEGRVVWRGGRV